MRFLFSILGLSLLYLENEYWIATRGLSLRLMINLFQVSLLFKRLVVTDAHTCNRNDLPHAHVYEQFIYTVKGILTSPS